MCKHGVNIGLSIGVNICVNIVANIQKEHFVCVIFCEIFILTLLCHTYIFLHFVCIILYEVFILTLLCNTYNFLHFACIILCEIFVPTLLCHTYIFFQLKGMEELKFYHSILSWYGLVTLFTLYLYGEKTKKKLNDTHRWQASRICSRLYTKFSSNSFVYFICLNICNEM